MILGGEAMIMGAQAIWYSHQLRKASGQGLTRGETDSYGVMPGEAITLGGASWVQPPERDAAPADVVTPDAYTPYCADDLPDQSVTRDQPPRSTPPVSGSYPRRQEIHRLAGQFVGGLFLMGVMPVALPEMVEILNSMFVTSGALTSAQQLIVQFASRLSIFLGSLSIVITALQWALPHPLFLWTWLRDVWKSIGKRQMEFRAHHSRNR